MNKLCLIAMVLAMPAFAQDAPQPKDMPTPPEGMRPGHWGAAGVMPSREDFHKKMLEKFDADKDGKLSDEEKAAMKAEMQKKRAERGARGPKGPRGERGERGPKGPRGDRGERPGMPEQFKKFDTDQDGKLSEEEAAERLKKLPASFYFDTKEEAMRREYAIKQLTREEKKTLIEKPPLD